MCRYAATRDWGRPPRRGGRPLNEDPQRLYVWSLELVKMKLNSQWIVGFVDGEGCFHVGLNKHKEMKLGFQVLPEFVVVQHERDRQILEGLKSHSRCGYIKVNNGDRLCYVVRNISHLLTIIIPFFEKHKLKTKKRIDFEKFRTIVRMLETKEHLTEEGLNTIKNNIKAMRKYYIVDRKRSTPSESKLETQTNEMKDKVQPFDAAASAAAHEISIEK